MKHEISLDDEHWNLIYSDQASALESHHRSKRCPDLTSCPIDHFDIDIDPNEITDRQEIMKIILTMITE